MAKTFVLRTSSIEKILADNDGMPLTRGHIKELRKLQAECMTATTLLEEYISIVNRRLQLRPHAKVRVRKLNPVLPVLEVGPIEVQAIGQPKE